MNEGERLLNASLLLASLLDEMPEVTLLDDYF
jgi:hypothetical protein